MSRKEAEKLIERGTWVDGYDTTRIRFADGVVVDSVEIDERLDRKAKRVWMFFCKNQRWSSQEFDKYIEQSRIADWRHRSANG